MASCLALFENRGLGNSEIAYIALLLKDLTRTQAFLRIFGFRASQGVIRIFVLQRKLQKRKGTWGGKMFETKVLIKSKAHLACQLNYLSLVE